jgi:predicted transcriptional regulator
MRLVVGIRDTSIGNVASSTQTKPTIWFDSIRQLAGVLSDENRLLLRLIEKHQPRTVLELAELSGRAASNLSRTLKTLESHGLVKMKRSANSRAVQPEVVGTEFLVLLD